MNGYQQRLAAAVLKKVNYQKELKAKRLAKKCSLQNAYDDAYMQRYGRWPVKYPRCLVSETRCLLAAVHEMNFSCDECDDFRVMG